MLDNIIGQRETMEILVDDLKRGSLPRALLFYGPLYSGKLSTALETARVLTCEQGAGAWSCRCASCIKQRLLIHPGTLLLGPRYFHLEIMASADVLHRTRKLSSQYLFIRSVRKLLRRFDSTLIGEEVARLKAALTLVAEIEELIDPLVPSPLLVDQDEELPQGSELEKLLAELTAKCGALCSHVKTDNIPIQQIRNVSSWAHISTRSKKIIIIENADRMQEASRNSLLKVLEEPPEDCYFFLLATRKSLVFPTIRSRLRPYLFRERSSSDQLDVLKRIFREDTEEYRNLRDYFLAWKDINPVELSRLAKRFLALLEDGREEAEYLPQDIIELVAGKTGSDVLQSFGEELLTLLRSDLCAGSENGGITLEKVEAWTALLHDGLLKMTGYNLRPILVIEDLYYRMREVS